MTNPVCAQIIVDQAHDSVTRLHNSVSQGLSHPNEQTVAQAENSLERAEQAVRQPVGTLSDQGAELAEAILSIPELLFYRIF
ncbi:MAG: hypothetical protein K6T85_10675 [Gorillibacterium sp.]|nr:hypothetical protein [Gorillibacterium sp.]